MLLKINLQEDEELRKAVLELVRGAVKTEIRRVLAEEARKGIMDQVNMALLECKKEILGGVYPQDIKRDAVKELVEKAYPDVLKNVVAVLVRRSQQ